MTVFSFDAEVTCDACQTLQASRQGSWTTDFPLIAHQPFGDRIDLGAALDMMISCIAVGNYRMKYGELSNASGT